MSENIQKSKNSAKKPAKLRARLPRGLADRGPAEIAATRQMVETIREVYERYGFEPVETPAFEYTDALGKFLPDQDRPNEGVFSLQDDDEQWISLRYDLTAPLARYVAENFDNLPKPYRSYRHGWVFRNEKPGPGRFRQFMQFDADTVGSASPAADAEMCMMAADAMEALGIRRGSYVVKVNNRKVLDGVMDGTGVSEEQKLTVLRAIDKFDRLGASGVEALLGEGRVDESGDRTEGAKLSASQIEILLGLLNVEPKSGIAADSRRLPREPFDAKWGKSPDRWFDKLDLSAAVSDVSEFVADWLGIENAPKSLTDGINELREIARLCEAGGYEGDRIRIDPSVVRGLEYYTGPVYEVELLLETNDEKGRPVRFGSVGGGGRYDGLVSRFRGEPVPATGFSIGVSRLQAALTLIGKLNTRPAVGPVVVTVFDRDRLADYQKMVAQLRSVDIRAELYLGNPKSMGNQLKYADKRNSPCVIIQGSDEKNDPEGPQIIVKDLKLGAELAALEKDRDEYLQKQADAQRKVPQLDLIDEVRRILARHDIEWK